jgi:xanthine/CO dehydrogenase XdhC/CoxF family maturation factor
MTTRIDWMRGCATALVTPFKKDGSIDDECFRTLVKRQIKNGVHLLVPCGNHDEEALFHLVNRGACYVGMIGSRRKIKLIFDDLLAEGISAELLAKVHAPVGFNIGSQTVPEIAVSIAAELIAVRNQGGLKSWTVERESSTPS